MTPRFFAVSTVKLLVMSLATAGVYQLYWFYQHWRIIRARGERLSPVARAFFAPFFAYSLFRRISAEAPPGQVSPLLLALVFITLGFLPVVPVPEPWSFIALLNILPLLEIQSQANLINKAVTPAADLNHRFTWPNVLAIAGGAAFWTIGVGAVIQARYDAGAALNVVAKAVIASEGLPQTVEGGVKLVEVTPSPRKLAYSYLVADDAVSRIRSGPRRDELRRVHTRAACERPDLRRMIDAGVTFTHTWRNRTKETLLTVTVSRVNCGPPGADTRQRRG